MRVRIGGAHGCPSILEDLNPLVCLAEFDELLVPKLNYGFKLFLRHLRKRQIVTGGEADHAALALDGSSLKQLIGR